MPYLFERFRNWLLRDKPGSLNKPTRIAELGKALGVDGAALSEIFKAISCAHEITIFTGAGMSVESGIPTFRDGATGMWNNVDPDAVASVSGFEQNPRMVWEWHAKLKNLVDSSRPNSGHYYVAELERRFSDKRFTVLTQNIDGFHQMAGSSRVFELHGSIHRLRCNRNCSFVDLWHNPEIHAMDCPQCGAPLRPDVVWFGEALNEDLFSFAEAAALNAQVLISVGTSAYVRPAGGLPLMAKMSGAIVVEVNPHETSFSAQADYSLRMTATDFFGHLSELG